MTPTRREVPTIEEVEVTTLREVDIDADPCGEEEAADAHVGLLGMEDDFTEVRAAKLSHEWEASDDQRVWVPTFNPFTLPHFKQQLGWLRIRGAEAAADLVRVRRLQMKASAIVPEPEAVIPHHRQQQELDSRARGLGRQVEHADRLRALIGDTTPLRGSWMQDQEDRTVVPMRPTPTIHPTENGLVDTVEAAVYLGRKERTLRRWRAEKKGPEYHLVCGRYMYRLDDLDAFLESCRQDPLAG